MKALRRRFILELAALGCSPWLAGCGATAPLSLASHVWPGYALMFLARDEGWLDPGTPVFLETASASESLDHLLAGRAAAAALTLDEVLRARALGLQLSIVMIFNISNGADAVFARRPFESLEQVRGLKVGVETGALGALMLHKLLKAAGLGSGDVEVVPLTVDAHLSAWTDGEIDVLVTFEPTAGLIEKLGGVRVYDSRALPDTIFDVLAVMPGALKHSGSALQSVINGHFRALAHLRHNPLDAAYRMGRRLGVEGPEVLRIFRSLEMPDLALNRRYLGRERGRIMAAAEGLARIMTEGGVLSGQDDMQSLLDDRFVRRDAHA